MIEQWNYGEVELPKISLELAKPSREIVARLKNIENLNVNLNLGAINEITFDVPFFIQTQNKLKDNPLIKKLRSRYHVKAIIGDEKKEEWYLIVNMNKTTNENGVSKLTVSLKSLGYQLIDKKIQMWAGVLIDGEFEKESLTPRQVLDNVLSETAWSVDYIDPEFVTKYRSFDFSGVTVLDAVYQIAETFGGIIVWNTVNKTISLIKEENVGINEGWRVSERKYLKSISKEEQADEIITRLKVYGKDGLSINGVNPIGTDYIEDYSFFMQGFERDENKNTISSSYFMSDSLCHALLDYQELVDSISGQFSNLLAQKDDIENQIQVKNNELENLNMDLKQIEDSISVLQTTNKDYSSEWQQKQQKESEIDAKQAEIDSLENQLDNVEDSIFQLREQISAENNFTREQLLELDNYIIEEVWQDDNYTDENDLYTDAKKVLAEKNKPKEVINLNLVNLYNLLEGKADWKKLKLGYKFFIDYERFDISVEAQIIQMSIDFGNNSISVTIANTKDILNDDDKLAKQIYGAISAGKTVDMSKYKWDQIHNVKTSVDDILEGKWNPATNGINAGVNNTVTIDRLGITIKSSDDPLKFVRMNNGTIGFTNNGGNTYNLAMDATGVYAEYLVGKIAITENLFIENASGKYSFDQNGVTIDGGSLSIIGGLPREQLDPNFVDGLFQINKNYSNGIRMDTTYGIIVTRSDNKARAYFNATDGFKFQVNTGSTWKDNFYYDINNNRLVINGEINALALKINGQDALTADGLKISGTKIDKITTDQLVAGNAKISTAMIENLVVGTNVQMGANATISWNQVGNKPFIPQSASDIGALPANSSKLTYISSSGIYTGTISADQIYGGTISGVRFNTISSNGYGINIQNGSLISSNSDNTQILSLSSGGLTIGDYSDGGTIGSELILDPNYLLFELRDNGVEIFFGMKGYTPTLNVYNLSDLSGGNGSLDIIANVSFIGSVNFSNATVTGLNTTAKFA
ncbi:phage tail protein [Bacillus smithii]|uniref:phage tail protein n=1 Tax=Bacillus smithii TaxID=1479 RepID=UPI003D23A168